jgi:hypothetical protein
MLFIDFRIFKTTPFILVLTQYNRKLYFCLFFIFKNLLDIKQTQPSRLSKEEEVNEERHKARKRGDHEVPLWDNVLGPTFHLVGLFWISLPLQNCLDLNPTIYTPPDYFASTGRQRNKEYAIHICRLQG